MDYENYYEKYNEENQFGQPPKKRRAPIVLGFIAVAAVFLVIGILMAGLMRSMHEPYTPQLFPDAPRTTMTPLPRPAVVADPTPAPIPTERPMASLDGVAPVLPMDGNPIPDMIDAVAPGVVGVINYSERTGDSTLDEQFSLQAMGSGFVISSSGYILTNAHVVQNAHEVAVTTIDGDEIPAEIIGIDQESDVAVLRADASSLRPLKLGTSQNIRVGDYVVAVGNPLGRGLEGTVTMGIISARARTITIEGQTNIYIQTDASINVGNSGGPLFNMKGEIIGITTAKTISAGDEYGTSIGAEGLGFALPIDKVSLIAEQLITKGVVSRSALGVQIVSLHKDELAKLNIQHGVRINGVAHNSPAETAGMLPGDIILSCDGQVFSEQMNLVEYISLHPVGSHIEIEVLRDGQILKLPVYLTDKSQIDYADINTIDKEDKPDA